MYLPHCPPWSQAFPPPPPLPQLHDSCSAASSVLRPCSTPRWRACPHYAFGFSGRSKAGFTLDTGEVSRFSRVQFLDVRAALGLRRVLQTLALLGASVIVAFPLGAHGRHPDWVFRSSIPRPPMPLSTLHLAPRGTRRKTRGQDGSLLLSCGALSSPTARRFIPALALPHGRGSVRHC